MTREQKFALYALLGIVLAFLIGFGWQYTRARDFENRLAQSEKALTFKKLESTLAAAIIEADRGNYEIARQLSSDFFTDLQANLSRAPQEHQQELTAISGQRDVIITAASRADPQTGSLLAQLYSTYRVAFGDAPVTPRAGAAPAPAPTTTTTQ
jgi:hypothetical protein